MKRQSCFISKGNDNIFNILNGKSYSLRFDIENVDGEWRYAQYETFKIADETDNYRLTLAGYNGTAGKLSSKNMPYTLDHTVIFFTEAY